MSDRAQLAALGAFLSQPAAPVRPAPVRISGLEALGRSSHGGAPVTGGVITDVIELEKRALGLITVTEDETCSA